MSSRLDVFDQFESFAMDGLDGYAAIFFKIFSQFGNVYIHGSCIEITVVMPDHLQSGAAVKHFIFILAEQFQKLDFFIGKFNFFI